MDEYLNIVADEDRSDKLDRKYEDRSDKLDREHDTFVQDMRRRSN